MTPKPWGWWTQHKLQILGDYLQAFATASSRVDQRIYLDLFAGWPENTSRETNEEILGSIHRALAATPPFTKVCLFELPSKAARLEAAVRQKYPNHQGLHVYPGDCNDTITSALQELTPIRWAPTFAFVDQFAAEVHWSTLTQIAQFKRGRSVTKAEMWILFGTSFLPRGLQVGQNHMDAKFGDRLTAMFGSEEWVPIIRARRDGLLDATEMRLELLNLMRWRLETELGYRATHPFTMKNTGGQELYHMIFASDHDAGDKIMRHLYGKAIDQHEAMRQHALARRRVSRQAERDAAQGADGLFEIQPTDVRAPQVPMISTRLYTPEPTRPPFGSQRSA
ncbi:three-Cys-motif partner protein TcmP [Amycolatopsis sp. NPDC048633]|uniref:three-Cys-motif partner protein TcmP n=1 Tax=Amycolatopsis sp. NPDC048633 TaxID=3157095 RepID=UPI0034103F80